MSPSAPGELTVAISSGEESVLVALAGELDIATAPALEEKLAQLGDGIARVVLDLRELAFIDSTGLRVVLGLANGLGESSATVAIVKGPEAVQRVFTLTGADRELVMVDDPAELDQV